MHMQGGNHGTTVVGGSNGPNGSNAQGDSPEVDGEEGQAADADSAKDPVV